jgi:hypothetical protein
MEENDVKRLEVVSKPSIRFKVKADGGKVLKPLLDNQQ